MKWTEQLLIGSLFYMACYVIHLNGIAVMSVDLGSEWLKVAIVKPGVPMEIALNKQSKRKTPLVVSMRGDERLFGEPAQTVSIKQPRDAYIYLTHLIGKKFDSEAVNLYKKRFPFYQLSKDEERGTVLFEAQDNVKYSVEELLAMMLNHTKHMAETFADHPMKDIVITVPAFFNQAERKSVLNAANLIGINVLQIMNDNTAVALNYGIFRSATFNATQRHILFYDMGASHTTATIVTYSTTKVKDRGFVETVPQLVVKGVGFDSKLGGLEMDMRLRDFFVKSFKANHKTSKEISENPRAMAKLLKEAKRVRQVLSANNDHKAQIENVFEEIDFKLHVTRAELEEMCRDLYDHVDKPVTMALNAAAMTLDDIETVVLMGGATRIPKVQEILLQAVKKESLARTINTDEAAALGSVYKAADLTAGFKVKRFLVKDLNLFPIDVQFERALSSEDGTVKNINRNLYHRLNPLPQKKIMTFNKKPTDFDFNISYGDLSFLTEEQKQSLTLDDIALVKLTGVEEAHKKNEKATPKGVKAYFSLDESGVLEVEKVEAHFEKTPELMEEEAQSTFAKLGSKLSSFFGSSNSDEETVEDGKEEDSKGEGKKDSASKEEEKKKSDETKTDDKKNEGNKSDEKTDDKKKAEAEKEKKTDEKKAETKETPKTGNTTTNGTSTNATEEAKPKVPVMVKEELTFSFHVKDIPSFTKEQFDASKKKLDELEARDQRKSATEKAYNNLESYIYEFKSNLEEEHVVAISSSDERSELEDLFIAASSWLDDDGFDASEEDLKKKHKSLKESASGLQLRLDENMERPKAIASMLQSLNLTNMFFDSLKTLPDSKEIYTEKDIKDLEKIVTEGKTWLMTNWKKQNESDPTKKPVLLTKDIVTQQGKVDRELMYLINKAKYYVPKPKPKPNTTESNTTKSSNKTNDESTEKPNKDEKKKTDESKKPDAKKTSSEKDKEEKEVKEEKKKKKKKEEKVEEKVEEPEVLELGDGKTEPKTSSKSTDETTANEHHVPDDEL